MKKLDNIKQNGDREWTHILFDENRNDSAFLIVA